jgi:NADH:ubiquinone oxidoreductase subunit C
MLPEALAAGIREACGDELLLDARRGRALLSNSPGLLSICARLRRLGFSRLVDFSGMHSALGEDARDEYALWAGLRAPDFGHCLLTLKWKFTLDRHDPLAHPSLSQVWPAAGLYEREMLEMLGLPFSGNENLRPLLLDERFEGHPLRLDYLPSQWPDYARELLQRRHEEGLLDALRAAGTGPALSTSDGGAIAVPVADSIDTAPAESGGPPPPQAGGGER